MNGLRDCLDGAHPVIHPEKRKAQDLMQMPNRIWRIIDAQVAYPIPFLKQPACEFQCSVFGILSQQGNHLRWSSQMSDPPTALVDLFNRVFGFILVLVLIPHVADFAPN